MTPKYQIPTITIKTPARSGLGFDCNLPCQNTLLSHATPFLSHKTTLLSHTHQHFSEVCSRFLRLQYSYKAEAKSKVHFPLSSSFDRSIIHTILDVSTPVYKYGRRVEGTSVCLRIIDGTAICTPTVSHGVYDGRASAQK
jgi:ribonuclease BN (tRNA processing enzyme)